MKKIIIESKRHGRHEVLVDDEDYQNVSQWKWCVSVRPPNVYALRTDKKAHRVIRMHRQILGIVDPKVITDHKDHNGLNNKRENLRVVTKYLNNTNQRNKGSASSKYVGVSFVKRLNNWGACIVKNNTTFYIGTFKTETEAAIAYNQKAMELHGCIPDANKL